MFTIYKGLKPNGDWKVGCDCKYPYRPKYQNLVEYFILEEHEDLYVASDREHELQIEHDVPVDHRRYADVYLDNRTPEKRRKISQKMRGRVLSEDHKAKIGESSKGRNVFEGKSHTEDHKQRMSVLMNSYKWYHNPITGKRTRAVSCPDGYLPGFS